MTFGVPTEISADGGPPFNSIAYKTLLRKWDVKSRQSSAHYAQSNGRAEAAVKSAKRILRENINPVTGELNTESAVRAILSHRNTPAQETGISPAMALYGHPLRDHLPTPKKLRQEWLKIKEDRERALAKRHINKVRSGKSIAPLTPGDTVQVQNQSGNRSKKWGRTGTIMEKLPNRQYRVMMDGSRNVSLRNSRFLRKIHPVCKMGTSGARYDERRFNRSSEDMRSEGVRHVNEMDVEAVETGTQTGDTNNDDNIRGDRYEGTEASPDIQGDEEGLQADRRSTRERRPVLRLAPNMKGSAHDESVL